MPSYENTFGKKEPYDNVTKVFVVPLKEFLDRYEITDVKSKMKLVKNWLELEFVKIKNNVPITFKKVMPNSGVKGGLNPLPEHIPTKPVC